MKRIPWGLGGWTACLLPPRRSLRVGDSKQVRSDEKGLSTLAAQ